MTRLSGRVLVLGSDTRSFLSVIRSLGRAGLDVHVAWCPEYSPALASRYIKVVHSLPYYDVNDSQWIASFNELVEQYDFDLVIPCDDASLLPLQTHKGELARTDRVYLLSEQAHRMTSDKEWTYAVACELGISLPRQATVKTREELDAVVRDFGFPLFLKPPRSAEASDPQSRHSVKKIRGPEEIESIALPMLMRSRALVQEHFAGIGVGVETLCCGGEVLVAFQHERVHEPLLGGGSSYRRSVPVNPEMLDATRRLMKTIEYTGVCMIEFRYNPQTRRWVLIEINGRFWGSLPLAVTAGVDFPLHLYEMLTRGKVEFKQNYRTNVYCRNWFMDLAWLRSNLRADKADSTLMTVPLHSVIGEVRNLLMFRERSDTFVIDDPKPAIEEITGLIARAGLAGLSHVLPLRAHMQNRTLQMLGNASRVLFVCKGNICRSPFAEYYMRSVVPGLEVASAGLLPATGRSSPDAAVQAAAKRGVDLSAHRSRVLDSENLDRWDIMFAFDVDQFRALRRAAHRHGFSSEKIVLVGSLAMEGPLAIPDPYGKDLKTFEATYERIERLIDFAARQCNKTIPELAKTNRIA